MLHDDISEQISRLKSMKNNKSLIVISVIARMVFMFYFFEPISFATSVFISLVGLLAVAKTNKILLSIYGYMTLFQAIAIYCFLMFFSMSNPQPILIYGVYSLFIVVMSVGASSSFSLRNQIRNYENMFGDVNSRTISNRANNDRDELQMIQIDNQQQPINSINNSNNNNYYIIPNNLISANNNNINNINNINNNNNHLIFQEDDSPQNDPNSSLIIPQHFIPNVYSSSPKLDQYILSPLQSPKVQHPQDQAFTSPVFQQAPFSPIPQFHIHFPNQMSSPTSSPYANQYQAQGVNRQQHPPSHFVPQVIHHQRNTQRRNVIYQI